MILREPKMNMADCNFIASCYEDWPGSAVFPQDVKVWIRRWLNRWDEDAFIAEVEGKPVGVIVYSQHEQPIKIHEVAVPPNLRGNKYASAMWREFKRVIVSRGTIEATFEALPGPIADLTIAGRFEKTGEGIGPKTGLPVVKGRVTADMDV